MGACVSVPQNTISDIKVSWRTDSKARAIDNILDHTSFPDENTVHSDQLKLQSSSLENVTTLGRPSDVDESFFDSHPWLDSDCEDFFSINGDFTPSDGNTPIHESSILQMQPDKSLRIDSVLKLSPDGTNRSLAELLRESYAGNLVYVDQKIQGIDSVKVNGNLESNQISAPNSVCSSEGMRKEILRSKSAKAKFRSSLSGCLPSLPRSLSVSKRKKKLSLANNVGNYIKCSLK